MGMGRWLPAAFGVASLACALPSAQLELPSDGDASPARAPVSREAPVEGSPAFVEAEPTASERRSPYTPAQVCVHIAAVMHTEPGGLLSHYTDAQMEPVYADCDYPPERAREIRSEPGFDSLSRCVMGANTFAGIQACDEAHR